MALISQAPAPLDLVTVKGDDLSCTFTITNGGSLQNWSGVTVTSGIYDDAQAVATNFTITTPSTGTMVVSLTDTQTTTLGVGVWRYSIIVTDGSNTRTWLAGSLAVMEPGWAGASTTTAALSITTGAATVTIGGALSNAGGALGYYGAFSDYNDHVLVSAGAAKVMTFGTTDEANGVSVVSGSRITFAYPGTYSFIWSGQFENANVADQDAQIWLRKNGANVTGTTGVISVPAKHGGTNGHVLAGWNFVFTVVAGDYMELVWTADSTDVTIQTLPAAGVYPSTASLIATVTQVMYAQVGQNAVSVTVADAGNYYAASNVEAVLQEAALLMYFRAQAMTGAETLPRLSAQSTSITTSNGALRLTYFTAPSAFTATQIQVQSGATAAGATPTLIRFGLYSVASNGDLTLVAATANDTSICAAANTLYTRPLTASYTTIAGQRYAIGMLITTAATAPTMLGSGLGGGISTLAPRLTGAITGLTDLPATALAATVGATGQTIWAALN